MQGVGEGGGAGADISESGFLAFIAGIGAVPGDDLGLAVDGGTVLQDAGEGQRDILHCGEHAHYFSRVSVSAVEGCGIVVGDWRGRPSPHLRAPSTAHTPAVKTHGSPTVRATVRGERYARSRLLKISPRA